WGRGGWLYGRALPGAVFKPERPLLRRLPWTRWLGAARGARGHAVTLRGPAVCGALSELRMRTETVSKRDAEIALPPKKPPAPSIDRWPRQAVPGSDFQLRSR